MTDFPGGDHLSTSDLSETELMEEALEELDEKEHGREPTRPDGA
jgi:hypothetical protein